MSAIAPSPEPQNATYPLPVRGKVLLRANGLRKTFGGQVVLDGINLELRQGEVVLLRGENGSGKTTLLNILTGNLEPDAGKIDYLADGTPRSYSFPRRWWQELNPFDHFTPEFVAREGIGRTWQDVRLFGAQSLRDNIAVAEPGHPGENPLVALIAPFRAGRREVDLNQQADAMLARLGMAGREGSSADKISLGQSKRVAIARAVAAGARILFLDEPLAGLDRQGIRDVLDLLESLVRDRHLTLVVVEHVFNFVHLQHLVNVHWMLEHGLLAKDLVETIPVVDSFDGVPVTIAPPTWLSQIAGNYAQTVNERLPRGAVLTRIRHPDHWKPNANPILEINDLVVERGARTVIGQDDQGNAAGFNLTLYEGEIAILQAPNGWGKSTLLAAIAGLFPAKHGGIFLRGQSVVLLPAWERVHLGLRSLPSGQHTFPSLACKESLRLAGVASEVGYPAVQYDSGINSYIAQMTSSLSGGQKQRLALACHGNQTIVPNLQVFDEPFSALDAIGVREAVSSIQMSSRGAILIAIPSSAK